MNFQCSKCGQCCKRAGTIPNFPEPLNPDGSCVHLQTDMTCGIYESRPNICRVNTGYIQLTISGQISMGLIDFYKENNKMCNKWIQEAKLPDSFLIDLNRYDSD